jgi:hypothetical protein
MTETEVDFQSTNSEPLGLEGAVSSISHIIVAGRSRFIEACFSEKISRGIYSERVEEVEITTPSVSLFHG